MATVNWLELAFLQHQVEEELETQAQTVLARNMYEGDITDGLLEEISAGMLSDDVTGITNLFNFYATVIDSVDDRLSVEKFYDGADPTEANQIEWASDFWQQARLDELQHELHLAALRDGESFLLLAPWTDPVTGLTHIKPYPHERYTSADVGGTNEGMKLHYRDNERPGIEPVMASKRWVETIVENGQTQARQRMTLYIAKSITEPGRIEKYVAERGDFIKIQDEGDPGWPIPWDTMPLPVIHFRNLGLRQQGRNAQGPQKVLDNIIASIVSSSSTMSAPMLAAIGGYPTNDGLPPEPDGSNIWQMGPRRIVGFFGKKPSEASVEAVRPGDMTQLLRTLEALIKMTALVTSTPSLLSADLSRHPMAAAALQQLDLRPIATTRRLQNAFGNSWTQVFRVGALMHNELADGDQVDAETPVHVSWLPADVFGLQPRNTLAEGTAAEQAQREERDTLLDEETLGNVL